MVHCRSRTIVLTIRLTTNEYSCSSSRRHQESLVQDARLEMSPLWSIGAALSPWRHTTARHSYSSSVLFQRGQFSADNTSIEASVSSALASKYAADLGRNIVGSLKRFEQASMPTKLAAVRKRGQSTSQVVTTSMMACCVRVTVDQRCVLTAPCRSSGAVRLASVDKWWCQITQTATL